MPTATCRPHRTGSATDQAAADGSDTAIYNRGALAIRAVRLRLGVEIFCNIVRACFERYGGGSAGSDDLIAIALEISDQNLADFFTPWLKASLILDVPQLGLFKADYRQRLSGWGGFRRQPDRAGRPNRRGHLL